MRKLILASTTVALLSFLGAPPSLSAQPNYHGGSLDARQHGYEHGYRDGFAFGGNSQVSNRDQDIVNQKLQAADREYQSAYGSQDLYKQGYSEGFRAGMDDGRSGNRSRLEDLFRTKEPDYNPDQNRDDRDDIYTQNKWPATHVANDIGYRDGMDSGIRDRQEGSNFQPRKHSAWRNAVHGYNGKSTPRGQYKNTYRSSFELGYRDGFRRAQ